MKSVRNSLRYMLGIVLAGFMTACVTLKFGSPPQTDQLKKIKVGVSTMEDVRRTLGEPRGNGVVRLSNDPRFEQMPRSIWFYEYAEAGGSRVDLKMLLVFFKEQTYDGHLWFSSAGLIDIKR